MEGPYARGRGAAVMKMSAAERTMGIVDDVLSEDPHLRTRTPMQRSTWCATTCAANLPSCQAFPPMTW